MWEGGESELLSLTPPKQSSNLEKLRNETQGIIITMYDVGVKVPIAVVTELFLLKYIQKMELCMI